MNQNATVMKYSLHKLFFSLLFLQLAFYYSSLAQQDFAPVGAKWYYNYWIGMSPPDAEYLKYESVKDTIISGKNCKKIEIIHYKYNGDSTLFGNEYMYNDSGKVYYYCNNQFYLIYDFTAVTGDTFAIGYREIDNCIPQTVDVIVDSIDIIIVSGVPLKKFYIHYNPEPNGGGWYYFPQIEKIGSELLMFGGYSNLLESPGPMRCYKDSLIDYQHSSWSKDCDFRIISSIQSVFEVNDKIVIKPHPIIQSSIMEFENPNNEKCNLILYNVFGKRLTSYTTDSDQIIINKKNLDSGIYFFKLFIGNSLLLSNKIIIN